MNYLIHFKSTGAMEIEAASADEAIEKFERDHLGDAAMQLADNGINVIQVNQIQETKK